MQVSVNVFAPTGPHINQQKVLDALDSGERWILLRAGRKWRKTSLMVSWLFEVALVTGLNCPFIAPTKTQAKNIVWDDHVQRMLNEFNRVGLPYKKNEVELSVRLPSGGKVQLLGVENGDDLRGISNWGAIACDEYDDWKEDIWPLVIRPNLITHKAKAIIAGTPDGYRNLFRLEQSGQFKAFHFTSMDNPDLDRKELEELKEEYRSQGMGAYRQEILAEYEKPKGVVYEEWDMEKQYIPVSYNPDLPLHLAWDWGVNDPTVILFLQPFGSELRLIDYYEASDADLQHFVDFIDAQGYKHPEFEAGDIAGRARTLVTGKSPISELRRLGHDVSSYAIPDLEQQIRNAHKFVPNLYVSSTNPRCARFRECILSYRYPKRPETIINQENETPIHDEFSHALKAFEYYCWNLRQGRVGGVVSGKDPLPATGFFLQKGDDGRQIAIDLETFK